MALILAAIAAALSWPARADDAESEMRRGVERYGAGDYDGAATAFAHAFALDPKPVYLFSWAQSEVARDRCAEAVTLFGRYLDTNPPEANRRAAEARLRTCAERLAAAPSASVPVPDAGAEPPAVGPGAPDAAVGTPAPSASVAPGATGAPTAATASAPIGTPPPPPALAPWPAPFATAVPTATAAPIEPDAMHWWSDPAALGLFAGGLGAVGVGAGLLGWAQGTVNDARMQSFASYGEHEGALEAARDRRVAGGVAVGAGAALVAGAVIRAVVVSRAGPAPAMAALMIGLDPTSALLAVAGRF